MTQLGLDGAPKVNPATGKKNVEYDPLKMDTECFMRELYKNEEID